MTGDQRDDDGGLDLSALGAGGDPRRLDELVGAVLAAAASELTRRRLQASAWGLIAGWRRPLLAVSALAAVVICAFLLSGRAPTTGATTLAESGGVPQEWVPWTRADRNPTPGELLDLGGTNQ